MKNVNFRQMRENLPPCNFQAKHHIPPAAGRVSPRLPHVWQRSSCAARVPAAVGVVQRRRLGGYVHGLPG